MLTKERIVSKEDVKSYLRHRLGAFVGDIHLRDGVAISEDLRKGLIRSTEVILELEDKALPIGREHQAHLASQLELELSERSIAHTTYKVHFV